MLKDGTYVARVDVVVHGKPVPRCPFRRRGIEKYGCRIHLHRPLMCRLFGTNQTMRCPRGCSSQPQLTDEEYRQLMSECYAIQEVDRRRRLVGDRFVYGRPCTEQVTMPDAGSTV